MRHPKELGDEDECGDDEVDEEKPLECEGALGAGVYQTID